MYIPRNIPPDPFGRRPRRREVLPWVVIAILAASVGGIAVLSRTYHVGTTPNATAVRQADLLMEDHDDGSISVYDASTHALVDTVPPKTNGFLRVVLAGMVRERRQDDMGSPTIPFHLTRWSDGRLTLTDAATHQLIELEAFGHTNEEAFARLLDLSASANKAGPQPTGAKAGL